MCPVDEMGRNSGDALDDAQNDRGVKRSMCPLPFNVSMLCLPPRPDQLDDTGQDGQDDDGEDHHGEVVLHEGKISEEVAPQHEDEDPRDGPRDVEEQKAGVGHAPDARHEGGKGPDDRQELAQKDRLPAVLLVEMPGPVQVLLPDPATFSLLGHPRAEEMPHPVVHVVADDGRKGQEHEQGVAVEVFPGGEGPHDEEERIPGKEGRHDEARLAEDDQEQDGVGVGPVLLENPAQVPVEVDEEIDVVEDEIHAGLFRSFSSVPSVRSLDISVMAKHFDTAYKP